MLKQTLAVIPARSGSKDLKDKNIKLLSGKPLMAYTIEAAVVSKCFEEICVSTDSEEYAKIARKFGATVPFLRSEKNSSDKASSWEVVREVLEGYKKLGKDFKICMLLQPTSPFRNSLDIINAFKLFKTMKAESVVSVCMVNRPVQLSFKLPPNLSMEEFSKINEREARRQDLEPYYCLNGAIYLFRTDKFKKKTFNFYSPRCYAYIMDTRRSLDIDTLEDFNYATFILGGGYFQVNN